LHDGRTIQAAPKRPFLTLAAIVVVVAAGLSGGLQNWGETDRAAAALQDRYHVAARRQLLQGALAEVPSGARLGYLSDVPPDSPAGSAAFFATQFAVAPRLLVERGTPAPEWWIGCFSRQLDFDAEGRKLSLRMVREIGGGMFLYHAEAR
jgi:hypothetical protein